MSLICIRVRNSFPFEWLCTRTRFETEACRNSEMGYCGKIDMYLSVINKDSKNDPMVSHKELRKRPCHFSQFARSTGYIDEVFFTQF